MKFFFTILLFSPLFLFSQIEQNNNHEKEHESFDSHLIDVLADLEDLKAQAESKIGHHCVEIIRGNHVRIQSKNIKSS